MFLMFISYVCTTFKIFNYKFNMNIEKQKGQSDMNSVIFLPDLSFFSQCLFRI